MKLSFKVIIFACGFSSAPILCGEHGGTKVEHGGHKVEHDKKSKKAHPKAVVTAEKITASIHNYLKNNSKGGVFLFTEKVNNKDKTYDFIFDKIHVPVRFMKNKNRYFACIDFHLKKNKKRIYDLDFWLDDTLKVVQVKVHKDSVKKGNQWQKVPRYTFKGEDMVKVK